MNIYLIKNKGGRCARYFAATEQRAIELAMRDNMARKVENLTVLNSAVVPDDFIEGGAAIRVRCFRPYDLLNALVAGNLTEALEADTDSAYGVCADGQLQPNGENWTYPI